MKKTPYQEAVEKMGKEAVDKVSHRTVDPETGYLCINHLGEDFGPEVRCCRCGGRGMWKPPRQPEAPLCLQCFDEWFDSGILDKYMPPKYHRIGEKKWRAAFAEFLATKPKGIDIQAHNRKIKSKDLQVRAMFPQYYEEKPSV